MKNSYVLRYSVMVLILFTFGNCSSFSYYNKLPNGESKTMNVRPGKKLVVSDSKNYGLWFEKSESDPRYSKKKLEKNHFYHLISNPGGSQLSQSIVVMHWIERDPMSTETIHRSIKETDYNSHTVYGNYLSSRIEPFSVGHWIDVERVMEKSEIISQEMWKIGNFDVDFYVSKDEFLVKKTSYMFPDTFFDKTLNRYFAHAFITNDSLSIEIFQPVTGGLTGSNQMDIDNPLDYSKKCIEDFIVNFIEVL